MKSGLLTLKCEIKLAKGLSLKSYVSTLNVEGKDEASGRGLL